MEVVESAFRAEPARRRDWAWWLGLFAAVAVDLALTWVHPHADPPRGFANDLCQITDGYWYLAEARAAIDGTEPSVGDGYRRPLITWPALAAYRVFGVSYPSSRALTSFASVATILLLAELLRRRFGPALGLLGAFLLACDPGWHAYVRSPVIYPWAAFWLLLALGLAHGRSWWCWAAGAGVLAIGALGLKSIVWVGAPAICLEGWVRLRRTAWGKDSRALWPVAAAALIALLAAVLCLEPDFRRRIVLYATSSGGTPFLRWTGLEARSGLFSIEPVLVLLAWLGLWARSPLLRRGTPPLEPLERGLALTLWGLVALFACFEYTPFRYLLVVEPALVWGAVSAVGWLAQRCEPSRGAAGAFRAAGVACALAGSGFVLLQFVEAVCGSALPATLAGLAGAALLCVAPFGHSGAARVVRRVLLPAALAIALLPAIPRWLPTLAEPEYTLERAARQLEAAVPRNAVVFGNYAHALTVRSGLRAQHVFSLRYGCAALKDVMERLGATHLAFDDDGSGLFAEIFARDGVALEEVDRYAIHGTQVRLYRLEDATLPRTAYEDSVAAIRAGEFERAARAARGALAVCPDLAGAWTCLGVAVGEQGEREAAYRCFEEALRRDPCYVPALLRLGRLFAESGYRAEALVRVRRAVAATPADRALRDQLQALEAGEAPAVEAR